MRPNSPFPAPTRKGPPEPTPFPLFPLRFPMDVLTKDDLKRFLKKVPEWEIEGKKITRVVEFDGFSEAVEFLNDVAEVAEDEGHHPDVDIREGKVILMLTTHDAGGVTETDIEVAQRLDNLID